MKLKYRPNVAGIITDLNGRILVCERIDVRGAWQFPQGGVDPGETFVGALEREMAEELSLRRGDYRILDQKGPYRYVLGGGRTKKGYHGQEQQYFLLELTAPESVINVATPDAEFRSTKWIRPHEFKKSWLPRMKAAVYESVLRDFFGAELAIENR